MNSPETRQTIVVWTIVVAAAATWTISMLSIYHALTN
jgi:hypothetical protein